MLCREHIALVFQSLLEILSQISKRGDFAIFPSDGPWFSWIPAWHIVHCESYSSDWSQNFTPRVSPIPLAFRKSLCLWVLRDNQIVVQFSQQLRHFGLRFFCFESSPPCSAGTDTCPLLCIPIQFLQTWHSGGCQYSQSDLVQVLYQIASARLSQNFASLTSASDTFFSHPPRVIGVGLDAWSPLSCRKLHWSLFEHCSFSFHW